MEQEETKPPFELSLKTDSATGLRDATLVLHRGFPKKFLGEYKFKEWTYGEKLRVELDAENIRLMKARQLQQQIANTPNDSTLQTKLDKMQLQDPESLIILQTLTTIRQAPTKLETIEEFSALPGRIGTLLTNVAGYLNINPDEEKKDWLKPSSTEAPTQT